MHGGRRLAWPLGGGVSCGTSWGTSGLLNNVWVCRVRGDSRHCDAEPHLYASVSVSGSYRLLEQEFFFDNEQDQEWHIKSPVYLNFSLI